MLDEQLGGSLVEFGGVLWNLEDFDLLLIYWPFYVHTNLYFIEGTDDL